VPDTSDTRDRVIRLETKLDHLSDMVEKNSKILGELYEERMRQAGAVGFAKYAIEAGKLLGSGSAGAAILHWLATGPRAV
jgi:hypothetical protein